MTNLSLCVRAWADDEAEPTEGKQSNLTTFGGIPARWFSELPEYAAELYALERWGRVRQTRGAFVNVRDGYGKIHVFGISVKPRYGVDVEVLKLA